MADIDVKELASRIDTVVDILVAGDVQSALRNLEILKAELLAPEHSDKVSSSGVSKTPWEI
ncbi:protein YciZ/DeoL [Vagococcus sp. WN89Y]|uniref:protein YciZ/DeoL n=1 Tax=Vagococcus sp. WN89Y TaxID=3457258 RepID=UPI003FCD27AC